MNEFDVIEKLFAPLSFGHKGALNSKDDVALIDDLVVTTDTLVEGTHFRIQDSAYSIGQKLVRVNVSDIIAKGCKPFAAFLNISWNQQRAVAGLEEFANGVRDALQNCADSLPVLGGDTTKIDGPIVVSLTILARPIKKLVQRYCANIGDLICVTGNIGDAKIGLEALESGQVNPAILHYQMPKIPKFETANIIANYATSSLDISDGLLGDAIKLVPKDLGIEIELEKIPFSDTAKIYIHNNTQRAISLLSFGDDYQCCFTIDHHDLENVKDDFDMIEQRVQVIGQVIDRPEIILTDNGIAIDLSNLSLSYAHTI